MSVRPGTGEGPAFAPWPPAQPSPAGVGEGGQEESFGETMGARGERCLPQTLSQISSLSALHARLSLPLSLSVSVCLSLPDLIEILRRRSRDPGLVYPGEALSKGAIFRPTFVAVGSG